MPPVFHDSSGSRPCSHLTQDTGQNRSLDPKTWFHEGAGTTGRVQQVSVGPGAAVLSREGCWRPSPGDLQLAGNPPRVPVPIQCTTKVVLQQPQISPVSQETVLAAERASPSPLGQHPGSGPAVRLKMRGHRGDTDPIPASPPRRICPPQIPSPFLEDLGHNPSHPSSTPLWGRKRPNHTAACSERWGITAWKCSLPHGAGSSGGSLRHPASPRGQHGRHPPHPRGARVTQDPSCSASRD